MDTPAEPANPFADELAAALAAARAGMAAARERFGRVGHTHKADGSEVTEADQAAERAMRAVLAERRPDDAVLGEEYGGELQLDGRQWVLDPIDGTTCFALGLPTFGTLAALAVDGEPVVGVIGAPMLDEVVYAAAGGGCWFQRGDAEPERVRVRPKDRLADAWVLAAGPNGAAKRHKDALAGRFDEILKNAGRFRYVGDCTQHALLCRGKVDVVLDTEMEPWDIAALVTPLREAGATVTGKAGETDGLLTCGGLVAASSAALHAEAMGLLG